MNTNEKRLDFSITDDDLDKLMKFEKEHENCQCGLFGNKLSYTFASTIHGVIAIIQCTCGKSLLLGNDALLCVNEKHKKENVYEKTS